MTSSRRRRYYYNGPFAQLCRGFFVGISGLWIVPVVRLALPMGRALAAYARRAVKAFHTT